jgi:hypothetical protein
MEALSTAQRICYCYGPQKFDPFGRPEAIKGMQQKAFIKLLGLQYKLV